MAQRGGTRPDDIAYLAALVRDHDRSRYYSALFAPAEQRAALFSIYGFAAEIARIADRVSEPDLGEIRLRWWKDSLSESVTGTVQGDAPALRAMSATMVSHRLPIGAVAALIDAHSADLYSDAPASLADVEGRLGETESALFQMAAIVSGDAGGDTAEAAGHSGVAYGLARRLARFAMERARGRSILPAYLLATHRLSPSDVFANGPTPELHRVVVEMAGLARHHLRAAREQIARLPARSSLVFLPLAVVDPLLLRVERLGPAILRREASLPDLEMLVRIGWARLKGPARL